MMLRVLRIVALPVSAAILVVGCASKPLEYKNSSELAKMDEFDKIVQIKDLPEAKSAEETAKLDSKSKKSEKAPPAMIEAKTKKSKKADKKDEKRQPEIEDPEGFVGRRPAKDPFRVGESVTMAMTYFGVSAGDMVISTKDFKEVNGRKSYHFHVGLRSSDLFSMIYFVDDWGETFVDYETLLPATMGIGAKETKKLMAMKSVFDHTKLKGYRWERIVMKDEEPKEKNLTWDILPFSQSSISSFFYVRNFPLYPGKKFSFRVADDGKNMLVKVHVLRKEKIKTVKGEFNTVVVQPQVEVGGIFQPMGNVFFWVTDDERKMFVRMEAEIKIGKVIGQLREFNLGEP